MFDFTSLAIVTIAAFFGAAIAGKLRQSVILGYLIVGVVIGVANTSYFVPTLSLDLVSSPTVVALSDLGIAFLLFFVGLEFSARKLKSVGKPSMVLALVDYAILLFSGFLLGSLLGWGPVDSLFLAGILAMSSLGIAGKCLGDMKRLANPETEVLLGSMVVENFLSMILLTISVGWVAGQGTPLAVMQSVQGAALLYAGFLLLGLFAMPGLGRLIERVRNEEVFILLALALVFASAGLAMRFGMPFIIGTFFIGMAFAETRLTDRLHLKLSTFRDAFVAVFFVHFGMNIDLGIIPGVAPLVIGAVIIVLLDEVVILSTFAVLLGFTGREAVAIGTAACGRGEDAIIYASIGSNLTRVEAGATVPALAHARELFPLAGGLALITSAATPVLMRQSARIAWALSRAVPKGFAFGGRVIGTIFSGTIGPRARAHPVTRSDPLLLVLITGYLAVLAPLAFSTGPVHIMLAPFLLLLTLLTYREVRIDIEEVVPATDFARLHFLVHDYAGVAKFSSLMVLVLLLLVDAAAFFFSYSVTLAAAALVVLAIFAALAIAHTARAVQRPPARMLARDLLTRADLERRRKRPTEPAPPPGIKDL